jgi:TRAP-type C4-dicarboxylate transport system permease small subunit
VKILQQVAQYVLFRLPEVAIGILTICLAILVNVEVFMRYVLHDSIRGSDEYVRMMFVWVVSLGAAVATRRVSHLGLNLATNYMPQKVVRYLNILAYLVICTLALVVLYQGYLVTSEGWENTFTMTGVSLGYQYAALPVSAALIVVYAVINMVTGKAPIPESAEDIEHMEEIP